MSKQKPSGKGSPKKQIKRLRRKAVATLRQARLTAQLELVTADAEAARIREAALAAAADEARAVLAEAELKAARVTREAEIEARTRRDAIVAEAMQEASTIRSAAN